MGGLVWGPLQGKLRLVSIASELLLEVTAEDLQQFNSP